MLVQIGVRNELAGRVRLHPGKEEEPGPAHPHQQILQLRRLRSPSLEQLADRPLVPLGLGQMVSEDLRESGVSGDVRRRLQLVQRLLFDRVDIGEVGGELFVQRGLGHRHPFAERRTAAPWVRYTAIEPGQTQATDAPVASPPPFNIGQRLSGDRSADGGGEPEVDAVRPRARHPHSRGPGTSSQHSRRGLGVDGVHPRRKLDTNQPSDALRARAITRPPAENVSSAPAVGFQQGARAVQAGRTGPWRTTRTAREPGRCGTRRRRTRSPAPGGDGSAPPLADPVSGRRSRHR